MTFVYQTNLNSNWIYGVVPVIRNVVILGFRGTIKKVWVKFRCMLHYKMKFDVDKITLRDK